MLRSEKTVLKETYNALQVAYYDGMMSGKLSGNEGVTALGEYFLGHLNIADSGGHPAFGNGTLFSTLNRGVGTSYNNGPNLLLTNGALIPLQGNASITVVQIDWDLDGSSNTAGEDVFSFNINLPSTSDPKLKASQAAQWVEVWN
jgi:hypothetical protein